jgi:hypothetical protein
MLSHCKKETDRQISSVCRYAFLLVRQNPERPTAHNYADATAVQQLPASGWGNWRLRARDSPEGSQFRPERSRERDGPRPAVLSEDGNLARVPSRTHVAPKQPASLRNPQSGGLKQPQQYFIARFCVRFYQPAHVLLADDPLRQALLIAGQRQLVGGIGGNVSHSLAEPEQALDRRQGAGSRDGGQAVFNQRLREVLEIAQSQTVQRLTHVGEQSAGVPAVAPPSMRAGPRVR